MTKPARSAERSGDPYSIDHRPSASLRLADTTRITRALPGILSARIQQHTINLSLAGYQQPSTEGEIELPSLKAMPGRVVLRFPPPVEKKGNLYIPETSQLRPEFGEVYDIGEPVTEDDRRAALKLRELQAEGKKVAVSFASGTSYWREFDGQALDPKEWGWLKSLKSYRLTELAAFVEE
jgi:hypothetical protein